MRVSTIVICFGFFALGFVMALIMVTNDQRNEAAHDRVKDFTPRLNTYHFRSDNTADVIIDLTDTSRYCKNTWVGDTTREAYYVGFICSDPDHNTKHRRP